MFTKEYFLERFKNEETEHLLRRYASDELSDNAKEAIISLLNSRGIDCSNLSPLILEIRKSAYRQSKGLGRCDFCGGSAKFSYITNEGQRFCSNDCLKKARYLEVSEGIPHEELFKYACQIKNGACPKCKKTNSRIEVRHYYKVWSAIYLTRWSKHSHTCCLSCGREKNFYSILYCIFLGWWGFPWGAFITPMQIISNIAEMLRRKNGQTPSEELVLAARLALGEALYKKAGQEKS